MDNITGKQQNVSVICAKFILQKGKCLNVGENICLGQHLVDLQTLKAVLTHSLHPDIIVYRTKWEVTEF